MRYYLIAGEPSGDLHGANLMKGLKAHDPEAKFRFWGGDKMAGVGGSGNLAKHYKETSFFGIVEVIKNLRTIRRQMKECRQDVEAFAPDVLILVDYPGFNMKMARWAKEHGITDGIGNGLGYNPALTTGQKWFIDKKGLASGITLAASTAGPAVLSPVLASLLIPSLGIFGALKALGVIFFVTIAASALFLKAPEAGWLPEGFEAPKGGAHAGTFGDLTPGEMVRTPRFWVLIVTFAFAATAGTLLVGKVASIAAVQLFADPTSAAAVALGGVVVSVNTCANLVGRLSFGQIIDKIGAYKSLLISLVVTIVALVIMSMSFTQGMFFVALALLGFSFGALLVIYPPLTGGAFGTSNIGVNYGIMFLGYAASTWISQPITAVLYHAEAGSAAYQQSFYGAIVIAAIAVVLTVYMMVSDSKKKSA